MRDNPSLNKLFKTNVTDCDSSSKHSNRQGEGGSMSKQREALQMALDALSSDSPDIMLRASVAIREALAEPEPWTPDDMAYRPSGLSMRTEQGVNPAPIGFWNGKETAYFEHELVDGCLPIGDCTIPLYAYPPTRKPLTDSEVFNLAADYYEGYGFKAVEFARAIESAHGIIE